MVFWWCAILKVLDEFDERGMPYATNEEVCLDIRKYRDVLHLRDGQLEINPDTGKPRYYATVVRTFKDLREKGFIEKVNKAKHKIIELGKDELRRFWYPEWDR